MMNILLKEITVKAIGVRYLVLKMKIIGIKLIWILVLLCPWKEVLGQICLIIDNLVLLIQQI